MKVHVRFLWIPVLFPALLAGCASDDVALVNKAAMAYRASSSDSMSRELALCTLPLIEGLEEDYRIGTEDVLSVSIFEWMVREETKTVDVRVSERGFVTLPLLGSIEAKDETVEDIETDIVHLLKEGGFIKTPRVTVGVKEFRSKSIAVVGAVEQPGRFNIRQNVSTLLDVLALAGGLSERAGYVLYVIRPAGDGAPKEEQQAPGLADFLRIEDGNKDLIVIDLIELLEEGNLGLNVVLSHRDVVYIPEANQFYVLGFVRKPGGFPLKRPMTVLEGIAVAEGLMEREASPRSCTLKRRTVEGELVIPLDLVAITTGENPNLYLEPGDIIDVGQTGWKKFRLEMFDAVTRMFHVGYNLDDRDF